MHTYIDTRTRTCIHNTHSQAADNCDRFRFLNRISRILWGGCLEIQIFYCLRTKLHEIPYHTIPYRTRCCGLSRIFATLISNNWKEAKECFLSCIFFIIYSLKTIVGLKNYLKRKTKQWRREKRATHKFMFMVFSVRFDGRMPLSLKMINTKYSWRIIMKKMNVFHFFLCIKKHDVCVYLNIICVYACINWNWCRFHFVLLVLLAHVFIFCIHAV